MYKQNDNTKKRIEYFSKLHGGFGISFGFG